MSRIGTSSDSGQPKTGTDVQVGAVCAAYVEGVPLLNPESIDWPAVRPRVLKIHPAAREWIDETIRMGRTPAAQRTRDESDNSSDSDGVYLIRASDVRSKTLEWLWEPRIPIGMLTLLVGIPGLGKTLLALWLATEISRGRLGNGPADVVIASAEDHIEFVLKPRLQALDADLDRIHFVAIRREGIDEDISMPEDIDELRIKLYEVSAKLLIVDTVFAHLSLRVDSHRDHSIRRALSPLKRLSEEVGLATLGIGHLNKAPSADIYQRVGGSIGLGAAPRSILLMTPDPEAEDDPDARVLTHAKSQHKRAASALRCRTMGRSAQLDDGTIEEVPVLELGDEAPDLRIADVLAPAPSEEERSQIDEAMDLLHELLDDGPRDSSEVASHARKLGISQRTMERARSRLGVISEPDKEPDSRKIKSWIMHIFPDRHPPRGGVD